MSMIMDTSYLDRDGREAWRRSITCMFHSSPHMDNSPCLFLLSVSLIREPGRVRVGVQKYFKLIFPRTNSKLLSCFRMHVVYRTPFSRLRTPPLLWKQVAGDVTSIILPGYVKVTEALAVSTFLQVIDS